MTRAYQLGRPIQPLSLSTKELHDFACCNLALANSSLRGKKNTVEKTVPFVILARKSFSEKMDFPKNSFIALTTD